MLARLQGRRGSGAVAGQKKWLGITVVYGPSLQRQALAGQRLPQRRTATRCLQQQQLGKSDLQVSSLCLGTMLFGESTSYPEAVELLDVAADRGVNFIDTAEMYPVPQSAGTQGRSEVFLGRWIKSRQRSDVVISSKVAGPSGAMTWIRGGPASLDRQNIMAALEGSLQRLDTDYIDVYHLHWPDRYVPMFGEMDYDHSRSYSAVPLEEQLEALSRAATAGKIRYLGLSNETPWGLMQCCHLAQVAPRLRRVACVQNAYSLLCRTFDVALAECCHQEQVSLLAYSPLAMGLLTGKYLTGAPPEARLNKYKGRYAEAESRYGPKPNAHEAVAAYVALAHKHQMTPTSMALRFVLQHPLVASAVIGATTPQQLLELLDAAEQPALTQEVMSDIDVIHSKFPNPTP